MGYLIWILLVYKVTSERRDLLAPAIHTALRRMRMTPQGELFPCIRSIMAKSGYEAILLPSMLSSKILLIDDHSLFRTGLRALICNGLQDVSVLEAASLEETMRVDLTDIHLILLDIKLQGLNGLEGIALLKRKWPETPVLVLSADDAPETAQLARERGARSFISKGDTADNILAAILSVLRGEADDAEMPAQQMQEKTRANAAKPLLTPRQYEVLDLVCQGLSNKLIARRLDLSENTVRCHVQVVLTTLQVSNRSEAAFAARRKGLVN